MTCGDATKKPDSKRDSRGVWLTRRIMRRTGLGFSGYGRMPGCRSGLRMTRVPLSTPDRAAERRADTCRWQGAHTPTSCGVPSGR